MLDSSVRIEIDLGRRQAQTGQLTSNGRFEG